MSELLRKTLNLFFPQWQGSGKFELYEGAKLLYESLRHRISFTQISTSLPYSLTIDESILGCSQIFAQLLEACRVIQAHNKVKQFYALKSLTFRLLYRIPKNKVKQFLGLPHLEGHDNPQLLNKKVKQFSEAPS